MQATVRVIEDKEIPGKMNLFIELPKDQPKMNVQQIAHLLTGGVNMLIKSCSNADTGIKDHELMTEVVEHLKSEFIDLESFNDIFVNKKYVADE